MKVRILSAVVVSAALLAGAAQAASAENGEKIVRRNCAMCHAVGARGTSPNPASPPFRELHTRYPVEMLAEALAEGILTGHPAMPEFKFTPREIDDIIAYLKSVQTRESAAADVAAPVG